MIHRGGLASDGVEAARPGDRLHVAGPPGAVHVPEHYDLYVLAADEAGLPALAWILERLPSQARGFAFVEVDGPADEIPLVVPPGVQLHWLHRGAVAPGRSDVLGRVVPAVAEVAAGERPYVWLSAEAGSLKPLRRWVREDLRLTRRHTSITGYWKVGVADEHVHDAEDDDEHDDG